MIVPPTGPLASRINLATAPVASAGAAEPRDLVDQLRNQSIEFSMKRKAGPISLGIKKLGLDELVSNLGNSSIQMMLPGLVALPLNGLEGLHALAVFHGGLSHETLPQKDLAGSIQQLAREGWRFYNKQGEIGALGAFNFLGKEPVELRREDVKLEMTYAETVQHMAKFYREESLAKRLEGEGWQFFTPSGAHQTAFQANKTSWIGRDGERWMPVKLADEDKQREALDGFGKMKEAFSGTLDQARNAWQAIDGAASRGAGVAAWVDKDKSALSVGMGLLHSPADLKEFAEKYPRYEHAVYQAAAERLQAFDESRPKAVMATHQGVGDRQKILWNLLTRPELTLSQFAGMALREQGPFDTIMHELGKHTDVSKWMAAGSALKPEMRNERIGRALAEGPEAMLHGVPAPGLELTRAYFHLLEGDKATICAAAVSHCPPENAAKLLEAYGKSKDVPNLAADLVEHLKWDRKVPFLQEVAQLLSANPDTKAMGRTLRDLVKTEDQSSSGLSQIGVTVLRSAALSEGELNQKLLAQASSPIRERIVDRELARLSADPELKSSVEMVRRFSQVGADRHSAALGLAVAQQPPRTDQERARVLGRVLMDVQRPTSEEMQGAWSAMEVIPSLTERAREGRGLCQAVKEGGLENYVLAALMHDTTRHPEDVAHEALIAGVAFSQKPSGFTMPVLLAGMRLMHMNAAQQKRATEVAELLALQIARRPKASQTIQEQASRVVVGGTFIRKRS